MTHRAASGLPTPLVWGLAAGYSALVLGAGVWVSLATGNWFAVLFAIGLTAPVEVLLLSRHRRRKAAVATVSAPAVRSE
ncbi:hypothetical protein [Mycetocola miduiensis]|uniref:Uncharacterized protein n=1 Tax=Mycetocola miduiensis TaxID=995034 RepID=A0A1I4ZSC5_9MICO|nr:hypothetical protein [Mycetocola miduiensis]SFN53151.1 hypothetical protein SAMN05216219_1033 [Mycetocola miduiensis]